MESDLSTRRTTGASCRAGKRDRWVGAGTTTSESLVSQGPPDPLVRKSRSPTLCLAGELRVGIADVQRGLEVTAPLHPITPRPYGCSLLMVLSNLLASSQGLHWLLSISSAQSSIIFSWTVIPFRI